VGFGGAGWAEEDHVFLAGDEVQRGQVRDQVPFQTTGMIKVELLDAFAGGASRAATSRCRHAARYSSWLHDSARARSASRTTDSRRVSRETAQRPGDRQVWLDPLGAVELKGVANPCRSTRPTAGLRRSKRGYRHRAWERFSCHQQERSSSSLSTRHRRLLTGGCGIPIGLTRV
jgi:hypothetical protein